MVHPTIRTQRLCPVCGAPAFYTTHAEWPASLRNLCSTELLFRTEHEAIAAWHTSSSLQLWIQRALSSRLRVLHTAAKRSTETRPSAITYTTLWLMCSADTTATHLETAKSTLFCSRLLRVRIIHHSQVAVLQDAVFRLQWIECVLLCQSIQHVWEKFSHVSSLAACSS